LDQVELTLEQRLVNILSQKLYRLVHSDFLDFC